MGGGGGRTGVASIFDTPGAKRRFGQLGLLPICLNLLLIFEHLKGINGLAGDRSLRPQNQSNACIFFLSHATNHSQVSQLHTSSRYPTRLIFDGARIGNKNPSVDKKSSLLRDYKKGGVCSPECKGFIRFND